MHAQLQAIIDDFLSAQRRLHSLLGSTPQDVLSKRPDPARWSAAECIAHLNLTSLAFVPLLREGIAEARRMKRPAPRRYHRDLFGWLLWKSAGPPARFRTKTTAPFVPTGTEAPDKLVADFDRLQEEQVMCVRQGDGLPLGRVKIVSPFNARIQYNVYACLTILPRHQHRHLWQAEQARNGVQPLEK